MNFKKYENLNIKLIPPFWINFPQIGQPIRIPFKPNIFLIPIKTPLPFESQKYFSPADKWTIEMAANKAAMLIGEERNHTIIISYELTPYGDLMSKQECDLYDVSHFYLPINDKFDEDLDFFITKIEELPSPGYPHAILISCHNGYNRTGCLISGFFMKTLQLSSRAATFLFSKKHPPGIFSQEMIDNLNKISPNDQLSTKSEMPSYIQPFMCDIKSESIKQISGITIDSTPNFIFDGGFLVTDQIKIDELSQLISSLIPRDGQFSRYKNVEFLPCSYLWDKNRINKLKKKNKGADDLRITFNPYGSHVFLIVDTIQNDGFYISHGYNQFYFFKAIIGSSLPRPVVCTAIYSSRNNEPTIFITDVLTYGELYMEREKLEDRLKCLWHLIMPQIKVLPLFQSQADIGSKDDLALIKLAYRPFTKLKFAQNLLNDFNNANSTFDGIPCNGFTIMDTTYRVGAYLSAPLTPTLNLLFILNTPKKAILYARSDYDTKEPVFQFFVHDQRAASLNRKIIRMKLDSNKGIVPVSICQNKFCDMISYSKELIEFIQTNALSGRELLNQLKPFVNKNKIKA